MTKHHHITTDDSVTDESFRAHLPRHLVGLI